VTARARRAALAGAVVWLIGGGGVPGCVGAQVAVQVLDDATVHATTPLGLEMHVPSPEDNPLTSAKVDLGRRLFHDPILSRDRSRACASCHLAEHAFADTATVSRGVGEQRGTRNAPALRNRAFGRSFFRDGRSPTLEDAVLRPIQAPDELAMTLPEVVRRLREDASYPEAFAAAFGSDLIDQAALARALASFVRSLLSGDAPADRYLAGDSTALTPAARRGRHLFFTKANCTACHSGPYLTDERFHNTGVSWGSGDVGREAVSGAPADRGGFRTPSLRDVAITAPYMHDGSIRTLEEVVEFYDQVLGQNPLLDHRIRPLRLSADERADLVAFLESLTGGGAPPASAQPTPSRPDTVVIQTNEGTALSFDLTPDGRTIIFDLLGQLWTLPVEGGTAVPLTDAVRATAEDTDPSISPDGGWVAFRSDRSAGRGIWLMSLADGTLRQLSERRPATV